MTVGETITVKVYFYNSGSVTLSNPLIWPFVDESLEVGPITKELPFTLPGQVSVKTFPLTALKKDCIAKITVGANVFDQKSGEGINFTISLDRTTRIIA